MHEGMHKEKSNDVVGLEKVYSYDRTNIIRKGGWDKMPGEEEGNFAVARACADGLEVLMKK
jgi:hypothetical protein